MRAGLDDLVNQVRRLIGDESGDQYTDDDIEAALDAHRNDLWNYPLAEQGTILPGGTVRYLHFYGPPNMGTTATIYDSLYTPLTGTLAPGTADWTRGYFSFAGSATAPYGPSRPLNVTGQTFDVTSAAVDLLRRWAAAIKDRVKYTDPNFTIELSQQQDRLTSMAISLAATLGPSVGRIVRCDQ